VKHNVIFSYFVGDLQHTEAPEDPEGGANVQFQLVYQFIEGN
jgi:hypothetical protein